MPRIVRGQHCSLCSTADVLCFPLLPDIFSHSSFLPTPQAGSCRGCSAELSVLGGQLAPEMLEAPLGDGNVGLSHKHSPVPRKLQPAMDQVIKLKYWYLCCGASSEGFSHYLPASTRARDLSPFLG